MITELKTSELKEVAGGAVAGEYGTVSALVDFLSDGHAGDQVPAIPLP